MHKIYLINSLQIIDPVRTHHQSINLFLAVLVAVFACTCICLRIAYSHFRNDGSACRDANLSLMLLEFIIGKHIKDELTNHVTKSIYNGHKASPFLSTAPTASSQALQIILRWFITSKTGRTT